MRESTPPAKVCSPVVLLTLAPAVTPSKASALAPVVIARPAETSAPTFAPVRQVAEATLNDIEPGWADALDDEAPEDQVRRPRLDRKFEFTRAFDMFKGLRVIRLGSSSHPKR